MLDLSTDGSFFLFCLSVDGDEKWKTFSGVVGTPCGGCLQASKLVHPLKLSNHTVAEKNSTASNA